MAKFENSKCAIQFSNAARGIISDSDRQQIFEQIDANKNEDSIDKVARDVTGTVLSQKGYEALQAKRTEIGNIQAQRRIAGRTGDLVKKGLSPAKAFEADSLGMSGHPGIGERDNAEARRQTMQHVETGRIAAQLQREKLTEYVKTGDFDKAIMESRWKQNTADPAARDNIKSPNFDQLKPDQQKAVSRVAQLMNEQVEHMRQVTNAKGAMIPKQEAYGGAQSHDTQRIRNAAKPGAINLLNRTSEASRLTYQRDLARMIDMEKTRNKLVSLGRMGVLEDLDPQKFMDSLWNIFALGVRKGGREGASYGGNIAAEAEKARILQFKGPAEQAEYSQKYGKGTMWESHLNQLRQMSHTIASLEFYGPSGEANFQKVYDKKLIELTDKAARLRSGTPDVREASYAALRQARAEAPQYLGDVKSIGKEAGLEVPASAVRHAVKTAASLDKKLGRKPDAIPSDLLRTTLVSDAKSVDEVHAQAEDVISKMKEKGYEVYAPKGKPDVDSKHARETGYRDIAIKFVKAGSSVVHELQILQRNMFEKKGDLHDLYTQEKLIHQDIQKSQGEDRAAGEARLAEVREKMNAGYDAAYLKDNQSMGSPSPSQSTPSSLGLANMKSPAAIGLNDLRASASLASSRLSASALRAASSSPASATDLGLSLMRDQLTPEAREQQTNSLYQQIDELKGSQAQKYFDAFQGATKDPGNMTQAAIVDKTMAVTRMGLLGGSFFSNIPVFWTTALQGNYAGVNLLKASFRSLFGVLERIGKPELQQWGRQTGVGNTGMLGQFAASMMDGYNGQPGSLTSNLESKFFKLVGLTGLKDMLGSNYVFMTSNEMAHNAGSEFDQLPGNMQRHLSDYRISPKEWDLIREHGLTEANGYQLLASDKLRDAPVEAFSGVDGARTATSMANARINTEQKLANLFRDSSDYATVEPDLKTRQLIPFINGTKGTVSGDLGRLTMQFSTWGFAHGVKVIQRQYASRSLPSFIGLTMGGLMLSGIISYTARQAAMGKSPLSNPDLYSGDPTKESEAWGKLLTIGAGQSGLGGMFGDLLFSQTYANGRGSALQVLGGPLADNAQQLGKFAYDGLLKHKFDGDQMLKFAQGNTPFINVWWIKPLMNYLLMYGLQEHLNPGSLQRMEKSTAKAGDPFFQGALPSQQAVRY